MKNLFLLLISALLLISTSSCRKEVYGCTDRYASNYNPSANVNNGTCTFAVRGCTDPASSNYNSAANVDDGSCIYTGQVMFWFDANNGTGTVNIANQQGTITGFVTGGVPSCGNSVSATFNLPEGNYSYSASATNGFTWSGTATVVANSCQAYQLH